MKHIVNSLKYVSVIGLLALAVGCTSEKANKENLAVAAGFKTITPKNAEQQEHSAVAAGRPGHAHQLQGPHLIRPAGRRTTWPTSAGLKSIGLPATSPRPASGQSEPRGGPMNQMASMTIGTAGANGVLWNGVMVDGVGGNHQPRITLQSSLARAVQQGGSRCAHRQEANADQSDRPSA